MYVGNWVKFQSLFLFRRRRRTIYANNVRVVREKQAGIRFANLYNYNKTEI